MSFEKAITAHYRHGDLLKAIHASLIKSGKTIDSVTIEDLAPVDEFHVGGRLATENLLSQLNVAEDDHLLDVGCGLGGAARYVVNRYANRVTGIDLTREYIETGNALCAWVKLDQRITLRHESALSMSFEDGSFDGCYMMHVGMNIEEKAALFSEIGRVLRSGAPLAIYDIMRQNDGKLLYPLPWAGDTATSKLATPDQYEQALSGAGFEMMKLDNRREFALEFFDQLRAKNKLNGGPPPLGLHTLMGDSASLKFGNMIKNIEAGYIAPVEMIAKKKQAE